MKSKKASKFMLIINALLVAVLACQSETSGIDNESSTPANSTPDFSSYVEIDIRELDSYTEKHKGEKIILAGEVFNIGDNFFQIHVREPGGSEWDTVPVIIDFEGIELPPEIYEGTELTVFGKVAGKSEGTNAFGAKISQARVQAHRIDNRDLLVTVTPASASMNSQEVEASDEETAEPLAEEEGETAQQIQMTPTLEPTQIPFTPTPLPVGKSRSNPIPLGEVASIKDWDIQVLEFLRGNEAWQQIQSANMFNSPAPEGLEYLLVKLQVTNTSEKSEEQAISRCDFSITGENANKYSCGMVIEPDPRLDFTLFSDGQAEGWAAYLINENDHNLLLVADGGSNNSASSVYLAIEEGASVSDPTGLDEILPTDLGVERNSPAPMGSTVITQDWEVTVVETVRGEDAWQAIEEANQFNDEPLPGMEYIMVKVSVKYIGTLSGTSEISSSSFSSAGDKGRLYDSPFVIEPGPSIDAELFPSGEHEGWVVVSAREGEEDMVLIFEPWLDSSGKNRRYLSLSE